MADRGIAELTSILRDARALVGGDDDALARELDVYLERLGRGPIRTVGVGGLFLPTGPLQELALEHGWGHAFLALADRFDAVEMVARARWACAECGAEAGVVTLRENGELTRGSFTRTVREPAAFGALWDAVVAADALSLDPEIASFFCPLCRAAYCGEHDCPHGLTRTLQDV